MGKSDLAGEVRRRRSKMKVNKKICGVVTADPSFCSAPRSLAPPRPPLLSFPISCPWLSTVLCLACKYYCQWRSVCVCVCLFVFDIPASNKHSSKNVLSFLSRVVLNRSKVCQGWAFSSVRPCYILGHCKTAAHRLLAQGDAVWPSPFRRPVHFGRAYYLLYKCFG
jgi:hypothetical protein